MSKQRILFICQHNSGRSQMAEEYLKLLGGEAYEAHSAGLEPTKVLPPVVAVMEEEGVDLSDKATTSVFDLFRDGKLYDTVVTVCSPEVESKCPLFPGVTRRLNWPFPDPALVEGEGEQLLEGVRAIRDGIKARIQEFIDGKV